MTQEEKSKFQQEIVDSITEKPHGRLLLAPRSGKTKLAIDLIKKFKPKSILWVTVTSKLAKQDIPKEFETWKAKAYLKKLTTVTWKGLGNITGHYEMIILDEEQHATISNTGTLLDELLTFDYITSMTGTPSHHYSKARIYKALELDVLYKLSINKAVDLGLLANYSINVVQVPISLLNEIEAGSKDKKFLTSEYANYRYLSNSVDKAARSASKSLSFKLMARMRAIHNSPSKGRAAKCLFEKLQGRKLFFCATQDQAEKLTNKVYHGNTDEEHLKNFSEGLSNEVAMVNKGGTGYTYKGIDHLVLTQIDSDKNGLTSQKIARALLNQGDYKAKIWIICLMGTQDIDWLNSLLKRFDRQKVSYFTYDQQKNLILKY